MRSYLSRLNRKRLFLRGERRSNEQAQKNEAHLKAHEYPIIEGLLEKFAPTPCGQKLIRVGPATDGGYLLPDDLTGIVALYSPGVSDTLGFDLEVANLGIPCFLADGTIEQPTNMHPSMQFENMMIGSGPKDTFMSMESWVHRTAPPQGDLMLRMDIEGAEYDVLLDTPRALLDRFRIIVLELHWLDRYLFGDERNRLDRLMDHLLENHVICHLHPNTVAPPVTILGRSVPPLLELTLLRKDRLGSGAQIQGVYPHPLDAPNDTTLPVRDFPPFWRAS
jgi:hypothetical protein